jgi:hypothetical protein
MDLRLATLKAVSFYFMHNVSILNQCRKFSCVTVVCKHFASYQDYPNYRWDLMPELNHSAQRCLKKFLLGILLPEPCISLIYT